MEDMKRENGIASDNTSPIINDYLKFKWTQEVQEYGHKLLKRLDEFRNKHIFYDVTLKTTNEELSAHKVVLAACGGIFRSHFVDPETKKIASDVTEITFACPAAGLRTILQFAYSGVLEITQENVLPTLLASLSTQMKEVQEICVEIALSRLGWILSFNGTDDSVSSTIFERGTRKGEKLLNSDQAFDVLYKLLECNAVHFSLGESTESREKNSTGILLPSPNPLYPCLSEVEKRWPDLKQVYILMIDCLCKAKNLEKTKNKNPSGNKSSSEAVMIKQSNESPKSIDGEKISDSSEKTTNVDSSVRQVISSKEYEENTTEEHLTHKSAEDDFVHRVETETATGSNNTKPKASTRSVFATETYKSPVSKPRTTSMPVSKTNPSNTVGLNETKNLPPSQTKVRSKSVSQSSGQVQSNQQLKAPSLSVSPSSPVPVKRKSSAPRPPPPMSKVVSPPKITPLNEVVEKSVKASPKPGHAASSKVPPPRPKPPTIKISAKKQEVIPPINYDEALNPFAEEKGLSQKDNKTEANLESAKHNEKEDYDSSLNPFG